MGRRSHLARGALVLVALFALLGCPPVDRKQPTVSSHQPLSDATDVPTGQFIAVVFSEAMDQETTEQSFALAPTAAGSFSWSSDMTTLTYDPTGALAYETVYTVMVAASASDVAGNPMAVECEFQFTTAAGPDTTSPEITEILPADQAASVPVDTAVSVTFSEAMDEASAEAAFTLEGASAVAGTFSWSGNTMVFAPGSDLEYSSSYTVTVAGSAADLTGNALAAALVATFTTVEPPQTAVGSPQACRLVVADSRIYDTTVTMEYSLEGGTSWYPCPGSRVTIAPAIGQRVWVRQRDGSGTAAFLGQVLETSGGPDLTAGTFHPGRGNWEDLNAGAPGDTRDLMIFSRNVGDVAAGSYHATYYLSADQYIDAADSELLTAEVPYSTEARGEQYQGLDFAFTVPAVPTGTYYILCRAGYDSFGDAELAELNMGNNETLPGNAVEFIVHAAAPDRSGAFKVVNSWGVGSWEYVNDGHYWVTYEAMKAQQMPIYYGYNTTTTEYRPTAIVVFELTHPYRDQCYVTVGVGDPASPYRSKAVFAHWGTTLLGGALDFPDNPMAIDISEFAQFLNDEDVFLQVENQGSTTGTIDSMCVELYSSYDTAPFKTMAGGTASFGSGETVSVTAATADSLTSAEAAAIMPPPRRAVGGVRFVEELPSNAELRRDMERIGVYEPGRNYNVIVNGHGTGFAPPSVEAWSQLKKLRSVSSSHLRGTLPTTVDHSTTVSFPPIGNQGAIGSCTCFSVGYYIHTYDTAREQGWNVSSVVWSDDPVWPGGPTSGLENIMSPAFIYNQINGGADNGSSDTDALTLLSQIGCASWATMPYDGSSAEADCTSWPSEAAWREAARYRGVEVGSPYFSDCYTCGYFTVTTDEDIELLKALLAAGYCVGTAIDAYAVFDNLDSVDVFSYNASALWEYTNHAQTVVGYKEGDDWHLDNPEQ